MKEKPLNKIFIDFDQTLCNTHFNPTTGEYQMGEVNSAVADAVNEQSLDFHRKVVVFTARPKREWKAIREWLDREGIGYHKVTNRKKPALYYVDDHAMRPDELIIWNRVEHQGFKGLPEEPPDDGTYDSNGEKI